MNDVRQQLNLIGCDKKLAQNNLLYAHSPDSLSPRIGGVAWRLTGAVVSMPSQCLALMMVDQHNK